ncbi:MAG TPA: carboxypeptidase regulatory-like domain-containing protein [Streptosporangiaceae bacterium]
MAKANFALRAGRLDVTATLSGTVRMGQSATQQLAITNTGTAAAQVTLGEQSGGFTSLAQPAQQARVTPRLVKGRFSPLDGLTNQDARPAITPSQHRMAEPGDTGWTEIPSYAPALADNMVADDADTGKVYSVGGLVPGVSSSTAEAYDPGSQAWTQIASMPDGVLGASGTFLDGKLYVAGGLQLCGFLCEQVQDVTQAYDPATDSWSSAAAPPAGTVFSASAALDGNMYVVGGCTFVLLNNVECSSPASDNAFRYSPATNSWTTIANYPIPVSNLACGGVAGELVCTGGVNTVASTTYSSTYIYNPATNTWSAGAALPIDLWGMGYAAASGQLLVSDGVTDNSTEVTNQGYVYDPTANTWTALPDSNNDRYMGGSACGFFQVGGWNASGQVTGLTGPMASEELPGYGGCGDDGTTVPWLSATPAQRTIPAGGSATVTVTLDGGAAGVTQPGAYTAGLTMSTDTPYAVPAVAATMNVTPPKTWGKVTGTVSGAACDGTTSPLAGATVEVGSWAGDQALITDADGQFALWLDQRSDPLTLIAADDGWRSQTIKVKVKAGQVTTMNFTLTPQQACS